MRRKKRDTSRKRAEIVSAAIRAFQEDGYGNTSMDRIAEVAGASKRTVYNHFPSKEALFGAVVDEFLSQAVEFKRIPYDPDLGLEEQLDRFAAAKMEVLKDPNWTGFMKVGLGVLVHDAELARTTMARVQGEEDHLVPWLEAATQDGRLSVPDPQLAAQLFWSAVAGAFFWPHLVEADMSPPEAKRFKAELIRSFLATYAP